MNNIEKANFMTQGYKEEGSEDDWTSAILSCQRHR